VGGIVLFGSSIQSASQVTSLTSGLQKLAPTPLLMATDQEGGSVNRFQAIVGDTPAASALADPAAARARGVADAQILHRYGFNFNLAPVVDVGPAVALCCNRTFGSDPARVAAMAGAYVEGLQAGGQVAACLKHFPGLGSATTNPDVQLPNLYRSRADWEATDVAPYRTLLKTNDIRAIMVSPEMVTAVDQNLPSPLSPALVTGVLREELGFQGVIVTDSLHTGSLSGTWTVPQAAVLAIKAGADIAMGANGTDSPDNLDSAQNTIQAIKDAVGSGQISKQRIDESVTRILTLKLRLGLIPMPAPAPGRGGGQLGSVGPGASLAAIVPTRVYVGFLRGAA
jgi:beta-N-acetylhexosaminidase